MAPTALKTPAELLAEAETLVTAVQCAAVSPSDRAALVDALALDLGVADGREVLAERRLLKLEAQVWTISEAIVRITNAAASIAAAVEAPKDDRQR